MGMMGSTERREMIFPKPGFGGTPIGMLEEGYHNAYSAILAAKAAMLGLEFNSRDYPKFEDWEQACKEREEAFSKMEDVETYIVEHINAICEIKDGTA